MNNTPFFSVITASFNSERTIYKTIESLLNQTYTNYEYIIIDGNSKDTTLDIIKSFESKFKEKNITYKFISEPDKGIYDAWNKGVKLANGEWISFIGSDDYYLDNALYNYFEEIKKSSKNINYISSKVMVIDSKGNNIRTIGKKFNWASIINNMNIAQVGSFHKKELFDHIGVFSTDYKIVGDLDFYIRCREVIIPSFFNTVTARMENNGVSNQIHKALNEALKVRLKYGYDSKLSIYLNHYIILVKCYANLILKK
ncbi:MAG: glycosyltransferase family 2 protein [Flavobacterium sp.]|jgi:glycosyltransferase involved in cell wall biosynthesis|uniref:Glycosyltransferase n=1 Tax=Flavobacterium celericrescens TaxID=2709780 RepID=A0ABX0I9W6_9FLAO|nr:glycosyltransferase family 2 protein [Flavobacterium celericrescens]NHM03422.1 glycosyltransferase [Flavobacterium celericrescens]